MQANTAVATSNSLSEVVTAQKQIQETSGGNTGGNTGGHGGGSGTTEPAPLVINEAGGIITITGTTSDAQISDILVGYELADETEGALSGVTVGGDATSGFTVPMSAVQSALSNIQAVKLVFAQG